MATVANFVHKFRKSKKFTQEKLANRAGVTRQTIIAMEKGNYTPSVALALKLAKVFRVKIEDLFKLKKS